MCGMGSLLAWGVFIFKFILGYEFITLSINYQFPMHPSFPYHLLRLMNLAGVRPTGSTTIFGAMMFFILAEPARADRDQQGMIYQGR